MPEICKCHSQKAVLYEVNSSYATLCSSFTGVEIMGSKPLSPKESRKFVKHIVIDPPQTFRGFRVASGDQADQVTNYVGSGNQAVVIGSQIAEFSADVPTGLRSHISNSFLLAQLAAKKTIEQSGGGTREWFDRYVEVLNTIGWVGEGISTAEHEVSGDTFQAHKEIIAVVSTALGAAAAAASIVLAALNGLKEMSKNTPWITLFDQQSQTKTVQQFQISYARAEDGITPTINLASFELSANASVTQILFFKLSSSDAKLHHQQVKLSMNETIFEAVKDVVEDKIAGHITSLVRGIEI
jgi:hypothetical protein